MRNIKLTIEYDGTHFKGWQVQRKGERTVQGDIESALRKIFNEKLRLIGSGRTDSGVHAQGQVANFKTLSKKPLEEIKRALNANMASDIAILAVEEVPSDFHAQYSAKTKTYRYAILNRDVRSAHQGRFCLLYPHKLNLQLMREEAKALVGRKDFRSFQATDPLRKDKDTVRTVKKLSITKKGDYTYIDVTADGFLYKMVRNIAGTLLEIGRGKLPKGSVRGILSKKNRIHAGDTARPQGLMLVDVRY